MTWEKSQDFSLFAELLAHLSSAFRHFHNDEWIYFVDITVTTPCDPRQMVLGSLGVH
jgi:hypothetical protein